MSDIIPSTGKVLVKFGATWCVNCRPMSDVIEQAQLSIPVIDLDLDEYPELAQNYLIRGVPTLLLFNKGKEIARNTGLLTKQQLLDFVSK